MNRFILAIGAGLVAVAYQNVIIAALLGLVPAVLLAALIVGTEGLSRVAITLEDWLWTAEALLLAVAFVTRWTGESVVLAILVIPVLIVLFILDLGNTPYPPLPPRR